MHALNAWIAAKDSTTVLGHHLATELGAQAEQTTEEPAVVELTEQEQGQFCDFRADVWGKEALQGVDTI